MRDVWTDFFLAVKRIKALRRSFLELYRHLHHFIMGWGKGKGYWNHHHHGHGIAKAVTEAAVIGGAALAGAAVATAVTAPRQPPPRKEVVVVPATVTPSVATAPVVVVEKGKGKGWWKGKGKGKVVTEVIEVPPLGISAVGVPANGLAKHEGTQFFAIDVVPEKGASYRVEKRYNDFDTLKETHQNRGCLVVGMNFFPNVLLTPAVQTTSKTSKRDFLPSFHEWFFGLRCVESIHGVPGHPASHCARVKN